MDNDPNMKKLEDDIAAEAAAEVTTPISGLRQAMAAVDNAPTSSRSSTQVPGYEHLSRILLLAYGQSANGKGRERHATNRTGFKTWDRQPIIELARMTGPGASAYQVMKKVQEACTMIDKGDFGAAKAEILGAIVYAAAMFKITEEMENPTK